MAAGGIPVAQLLAPGRLEATLTWMAERRLEPPEAAAAAAAELVEAIVLDQRRLLCCAVQCQGEFGIDGLVAGVPVKVGKDGVGEILELALSDSEREALHEACAASHRLARAFLDA
jgi:malate dehydrogenase